MSKLNWNEKRPYPVGYRAGPVFKDYRVLKEIVLETFRIEWHDAIYFSQRNLELVLYPSDLSRVSMRLLRYYRQGLLARRRKFHRFEYILTSKGKYRLLYLWEKLGMLKIPPWDDEEPELSQVKTDYAKMMIKLANSIREGLDSEKREKEHRLIVKKIDELYLEKDRALSFPRPREEMFFRVEPNSREPKISEVFGFKKVEDKTMSELFGLDLKQNEKGLLGVEGEPSRQKKPEDMTMLELYRSDLPKSKMEGQALVNGKLARRRKVGDIKVYDLLE